MTDWHNGATPGYAGYQNYVDRSDVNGGLDFGYKVTEDLAVTVGYRYGHQYQQAMPDTIDTLTVHGQQAQSSADYQRLLLGVEGKPVKWLKVELQAGPDFRNYAANTETHITPVNDKNPVKLYGEAALAAEVTANDSLAFKYKGYQWVSGTGTTPYFESSYDLTYRAQYYTVRGLVHHVDFRGKPRPGTDYDIIAYGVQDKGVPNSGSPPQKYSGISLLAVGQSDLGNGWTARANINYITSFRFRQNWSESYNDIVGSEIHSVGYINKNWDSFTVNTIFARLQNFQTSEIEITDPGASAPHYVANAVTIRKLPEEEFTSRDRRIWDRLPFYFSFDSSAGLLYRSYPIFNSDNSALVDNFQTGEFMNRCYAAATEMTTAAAIGA